MSGADVTSQAGGLLLRSGASPGRAEGAALVAVHEEITAGEAAAAVEAVARHRRDALSALRRGRGACWAADITGLPLRLVARVAAENRIPLAPPEPDRPGELSLWDALVARPGRLLAAVA